MARIVQKNSNFAAGTTTVTVSLSGVRAGNALVAAIMAADGGAAVATDGDGSSRVALTDTLGNTYHHAGSSPHVFGDRTHNTSLLCGVYLVSAYYGDNLPGGSVSLTFTFTAVSTFSNVHVGVVIYEVEGISGTETDTAYSGPTLTQFPPQLQGDLTWIGETYGVLHIVAAAAFTNNNSQWTSGSAFALDAVHGSNTDGFSTLAAQSRFLTGASGDDPANFGGSPSSSAGIAGATVGVQFSCSTPPIAISNSSNLPDAQLHSPYSQTFSAANGTGPYTWSAPFGVPSGLSLNSSTGVLSGTPTVGGNYVVTIQAVDAVGEIVTANFNLDVVSLVGCFPSYAEIATGQPQPRREGSGSAVSHFIPRPTKKLF